MRTITGPLFSFGLKLIDRMSNFESSKFMVSVFCFYSLACIINKITYFKCLYK